MAYFAELDQNGECKRIIVADAEFIASGAVGDPANWIEVQKEGGARVSNVGNCDTKFDPAKKVFIAEKPFKNFVLDENNQWVSPIQIPNDGLYRKWDEVKEELVLDDEKNAKRESDEKKK